jgi:hypothetical protein
MFPEDGRVASEGWLGRRGVGRKVGGLEEGDRDCLCAIT